MSDILAAALSASNADLANITFERRASLKLPTARSNDDAQVAQER